VSALFHGNLSFENAILEVSDIIRDEAILHGRKGERIPSGDGAQAQAVANTVVQEKQKSLFESTLLLKPIPRNQALCHARFQGMRASDQWCKHSPQFLPCAAE
jgi:hypothetical protein